MPNAQKIAGQVAIVALGVIAGGYIMWQMRDIGVINEARNGFDVGLLD